MGNNTLDEKTIIAEEARLHDTRKKSEVYPLSLYEEAKWINETPELKKSLDEKRKRLLRLARLSESDVERLFAGARKRLSADDYATTSVFLTEFHPSVEKLTEYINRLLSINTLLSATKSLVMGGRHGFKKIDIENQKQKDLQTAEALGIDLKKAGNVYKGLCPFHAEKTPSFILYPNPHQFTCFGCGESMDTIGLVMKIQNFSFVQALTFLERL